MDYRDKATTQNHVDFKAFMASLAWNMPRLALMTTAAQRTYTDFAFAPTDVIILGQESAGAPAWLHERADARLRIPMAEGTRSINMAVSAGMALGEALRQTNSFPTASAPKAPQ